MPNADAPASAASDLSRIAASLVGPDPLNWVITGDSITHGLVHTQGGRSYAEHLHELIRGELARTRDAVINTAISGHRITDILDDWDRRVASWQPDIVTLMIGTNDMATGPGQVTVEPAAFAASLREFVSRVRASGAVPVLQTPPSIDEILAEVDEQIATLPRADIARASLAEARAIWVPDLDTACAVSNAYGPEHLALQTEDAETRVDKIIAAGAVFVGAYAAETLGDYAAGPSHVLPTDGGAKTLGGVTTASFMTSMSVQSVSEKGAAALAPVAARLARLEGLEAHARAADLRVEA